MGITSQREAIKYGSDILNKSENTTHELFAIYLQMMQASKANESVSECSKTGLCITVKASLMLSRGKT